MKITSHFLIISIFLLLSGSCIWKTGTENIGTVYYIAPNGNDAWSGKLISPNENNTDGPFATLEKARDEIRGLKKNGNLPRGPVTVRIRGGVYPLTKTFQLTDEDSGTKDTPIIYRAYGDKEVLFSGGKEISAFKNITDPAILNRLDEKCRDKILQADLKEQGITDFGELAPRGFGRQLYPAALELFFNDMPMTMARWPNSGYEKIAGTPDGQQGGKFTFHGIRPKRWSDTDDIWLHGYWTYNWADSYEKIKSVNIEKQEIATCEPHGVYGYSPRARYYYLNILEEIDEPGEWYLDRKTGILYFWPPEPLDKGRVFVSILKDPMFSLKNVSYVTGQGLAFKFCRGTALEVIGGEHNIISGCTIKNIGNIAVRIEGGKENGITGCDISETGDGAIVLAGGDRLTLTPAGNYATNNHIHHYSQWVKTYQPAILISGVGNRIAHNLIHDAPHNAILLSGNDHIIEFNEIHHVVQDTGDAGAFYLGRDFTERGNIVRYNYFHHIGGFTERNGFNDAMAVYLDDCASGSLVYGNVFYKAGRAVLIGGGRDNTVDNNIFVECNQAVHVDARGTGWAKKWFDGTDTTLFDRLKAVHYNQPPYSTKYKELVNLCEDEPAIPKGNLIIHNICMGGQWLEFFDGLTEKTVMVQANLTEGDPLFVDMQSMNFQLKDESPAYKLGFKRIPMEQIGLYNDKYRRNLPTDKNH
jgi:hypothetical protein